MASDAEVVRSMENRPAICGWPGQALSQGAQRAEVTQVGGVVQPGAPHGQHSRERHEQFLEEI